MKIIITSFALLYATSTASADNYASCYPEVSPVDYDGYRSTFMRQKYNSECVDSTGQQFEYGTIIGVYPPIDTPGGGCSNFCIKGYGTAEARGCNQFPPAQNLVGFEYDCEQATCKCLYQAGTLSNQYSKCFDDMNTSNQGDVFSSGSGAEMVYTLPSQGQTCYARVFDGPPSPAPPAPTPPLGSGICTYTPDFDCYVDGHPPCCNENGGQNCPNYLTMCDNHAQGMTGSNYCTNSPSYQCYDTPTGHPACCNEPGGAYMHCPKTQPGCDNEAVQFVKYLRSNRK